MSIDPREATQMASLSLRPKDNQWDGEFTLKRKIEPLIDAKTGTAKAYQIVAKKYRSDGTLSVVDQNDAAAQELLSQPGSGPPRTSGLLAPNVLLTGHGGHVHCCKFSHSGTFLASGSFDKTVLLWNTYGNCDNWGLLKGHSQSVVDLCWGREDDIILTASADKTGAVWDVNTSTKIKRFRHHKAVVNSVCTSRRGDPLAVTGSDDCTALIWDLRVRNEVDSISSDYQITSVVLSDDSSQLFTAGIDNEIKCWNLLTGRVEYVLQGHNETVTGLSLSPDGSYLLSNAMDGHLKCWDVRPFVSDTRLVNTYEGHSHDMQQWLLKCSWSPDARRISCGSSDGFVYVWDVDSRRIQYKLPGHKAAVSAVEFSPQRACNRKLWCGQADIYRGD
jgi:Prp8 binding protein